MPAGQARAARTERRLVVLRTFRSIGHRSWLAWDSGPNAGAVDNDAGLHCKRRVLADLRSSLSITPNGIILLAAYVAAHATVSSNGYVASPRQNNREPAVCMLFRFFMNYRSPVVGKSLDLPCCPKGMSYMALTG